MVAADPDSDDSESEQADEAFLADWEDIYLVGTMLREMTMTHVSFNATGAFNDGIESARPDNMLVAAVNALPTAPPYSAALITMLQAFEWAGQEGGGSVRELKDNLEAAFPSAAEIMGVYLPQAQAQMRAFRDRAGKPRGYYTDIDVSWTKPPALMPFEYNLKYATVAGDHPRGAPGVPPGFPHPRMAAAVPQAEVGEEARMRKLGELHRWDNTRPYLRAVAVTYEDGMADCRMLPRPPGR